MSREYATKGGLNEQVWTDFDQNGGTRALVDAPIGCCCVSRNRACRQPSGKRGLGKAAAGSVDAAL
ncbi:hypothetical protein GGE07_005185 [Sinorhizobium terangae]|nr:hypothetical protein [Sinorhizobium terangae]